MNYRNKKLLDSAKGMPCQNCGIQDGTVVAAHSNQYRDGRGMGIKAKDFRIAYLCSKCHYLVDFDRDLTKDEKTEIWEAAHRKTIGLLFETGVVK